MISLSTVTSVLLIVFVNPSALVVLGTGRAEVTQLSGLNWYTSRGRDEPVKVHGRLSVG